MRHFTGRLAIETVNRESPFALPDGAETGTIPEKLSTYAFIVGLENYQAQPKPIKPVAYAEADAKAMAMALGQLGFPAGYIEILLSEQATKTSFKSRFKAAGSGLAATDSFVFFFAGHGLSINDRNYLTCHDTQRGDLAATSIRLDWIFDSIRKTKCQHATFFLDCCHSGLPIEDSMRGIADHITDAEFKTLFGSSEYHVAFAACKPDESSHSSHTLSHGIWTHHLLRALHGEDPDALDRGRFVTSHSLQTYLAVEVPRTLRKTIAGAARQTPCSFGNATAGFIIADLKPILDAHQAAIASKATAPRDAAFVGLQYGSVKSLSGFKRFHTVPKDVNGATQRFVAGICEEEVKEHANKVLSSLRSNLGYGIKDVDRSIAGDSASLKTKDFDVNIGVSQCDEEPDTYALRTEITNFRTPPVVGTPEFNQAVSRFVDMLELQLPAKFDVADVIARLEKSAIKDSVDIEYDTALSNVEIRFDTGVSFRFKDGLCEVTTDKKTNPLGLLEAVSKTQAALVTNGSVTIPLLKPKTPKSHADNPSTFTLATKKTMPQWADYRELDLGGKRLETLQCKIQTESPYFRFGFKLLNETQRLFGDGSINSQDANLLIHIGRNNWDRPNIGISPNDIFLTWYLNGNSLEADKKLLSTKRRFSAAIEFNIDNSYVASFSVNGICGFSRVLSPKICQRVAILAWGDREEFTVQVSDFLLNTTTGA